MRSFRSFAALPLALFCILSAASAQRHDVGSAPPTAPPPKPVVAPQSLPPAGPSLGALQLSTVNYDVSAPESLVSQLQTSNDRTRAAALAAIGAPAQYLDHGRIPFPHSIRLDLVALGTSNELDAILTVELDQHLVSAILMPEDDQWHRIATALYPAAFSNPATNPSTFLHTDRSLREPQRYTAIFHTTTSGSNGDFTETEVHLRILNGHAAITTSFASTERSCDPTHQRPCDITQRWLQPDTTDPEHRFLLVTATGHDKPNEAGDPIAHTETFEDSHLRTFTCQPFAFSDTTLRFEPTADPAPCISPHDAPHDQQHEQPLH
jgi:hypothetical protein